MKKIIALLLCAALVLSLCACATTTTKKNNKTASTTYVQGNYTEAYEDVYVNGGDNHTTEVVEKRIPVKTGATVAQDLTGNRLRAANIESGEDQAFLDGGILKDAKGNISGNMTRVANAIRKLKAGKDIKVVTYGGINCGGTDSYGMVLKEHLETMGSGKVNLVEYGDDGTAKTAGREAMNSGIAAYMINSEVIELKPDIVILDFMGDGLGQQSTKANSQAFENMVRRVLTKTSAGLIIVCGTAATEDSWAKNTDACDPKTSGGKEIGYYHKQVAEYYGLPVIDFEGIVWKTISELVEKKYYSESTILSWASFATDAQTYSFAAKINIGNMLSLYCDKVAKKLNDSSTKKEPTYSSSFKFTNKDFMETDFVNLVDVLDGKKIKGFSCTGPVKDNKTGKVSIQPLTVSHIKDIAGKTFYDVNTDMISQTYTLNKNVKVSYRQAELASLGIEYYNIPKVKDGNKCYFIATYNGTNYQLSAKHWSIECFDSADATMPFKTVSQGRSSGLSIFLQEIPKGTVKVRLTYDVDSVDIGSMTWFGFASKKGFN